MEEEEAMRMKLENCNKNNIEILPVFFLGRKKEIGKMSQINEHIELAKELIKLKSQPLFS